MLAGIMGFTTIATTAAAAVPQALRAYSSYQQGKKLQKTAAAQQQLADRQAAAMQDTAAANQSRAARNAVARLAQAGADAAASNLVADGSVAVREQDLATRLQDEISAHANAALNQADEVQQQGRLQAWQTRGAAAQSRLHALGGAASAVGSLLGGVASSLHPREHSRTSEH